MVNHRIRMSWFCKAIIKIICKIGRIKGISQDADGDIVIDVDIDKESVTGEERE